MIALPPLRPYQAKLLAEARSVGAELARERTDGGGLGILIQLATGGGKTLLALHLAIGAIEHKGHRVLWLAGRDELVNQPVARLAEFGVKARVLSRGRASGDPASPITIASIQTLLASGEAPPADLVIFDEARHFVAAQWGQLAARYRSAIRIGLDATPAREDGAPLGDLFDRIIIGPSVQELTAGGFLVPCAIYAPDPPRKEALSEDPALAYHKLCDGKRAIIYGSSVAHARRIAADLRDAGIAAEAVDGKTSEQRRKAGSGRNKHRIVATGELRLRQAGELDDRRHYVTH